MDVSNDRAEIRASELREIKEFRLEGRIQPTQAHLGEDGSWIAAYVPGGVRIVHIMSGKRIEVAVGPESPHDGALSPDGRFLALGMDSPEVRVYELRTGEKIGSFQVAAGYS